jgi:hypothetical protein
MSMPRGSFYGPGAGMDAVDPLVSLLGELAGPVGLVVSQMEGCSLPDGC